MSHLLAFLVSVLICNAATGSSLSMPSTWLEFETTDDKSFEKLFYRFEKGFAKEYNSAVEKKQHFNFFTQQVSEIFEWNSKSNNRYKKGITRFTDMFLEERKSFVMTERVVEPNRAVRSYGKNLADNTPIAKPLNGAGDATICDLRKFATPIKDQGSCGSCWAFGTIAAAESSHFLWSLTDPLGNDASTGNDEVWQLSEQVLVDCCDAYDCNGCGGGGTYEPMQCAVDIGTLPSTISHGYTATDNATCSYNGAQAAAFVDSYFEPCSPGDEKCLKTLIGGESCTQFFTTALKTSIQVIDSFYDYTGGIYSDPNCPSDKHNHAVAIVGWGTERSSSGETQDYWILRNSWGTNWGMEGYFYMERGSNMCCVACENLFFQ